MNEMQQIGKFLIVIGLLVAAIGVIIVVGGKLNLFNLPCDMSFEGKNWKLYFPIGTSILVSIILTIVLWIVSRFFR